MMSKAGQHTVRLSRSDMDGILGCIFDRTARRATPGYLYAYNVTTSVDFAARRIMLESGRGSVTLEIDDDL